MSLLRFYELTERMSKMEASIAPIVTKLDSILGRIEDAKRIKMQKKVAMQSFITNIEDDDQREIKIKQFFFVHMHNKYFQLTMLRKDNRSEISPREWSFLTMFD